MVQKMACESPNRFAAMASLGSSMDTVLFKECIAQKDIPFAFFNGTNFPAMPYNGGPMQNPQVVPVVPVDSVVQFWVKKNNCRTAQTVINLPDVFVNDSSTIELYKFESCDCNANISFYKILNGGHTWPGVYVASQASILGNTNRDINASVELWKFFSAHTLCNKTVGINDHTFQSGAKIYPNPATTILHIQLTLNESYKLTILNYFGQTILTANNQTQIDITDLTNGIYFIIIQQGQKATTKKLVKQ